MPHSFDLQTRRALAWLAVFALIGALQVWLYPDAEQQDSAYHFLFARWAGQHPAYFISVWGRPLFTLIYFLPSQLGYAAAKLFTVAISLAAGWQTFRLARELGFGRAELAVPLLFLQPAFFALSSVVMTEMLFALLFVVALRLHISGYVKSGMLTASLLILVRPEGLFIGVLWGLWVLRIADCGLRIPSQHSPKIAPGKIFRSFNPQSAIRNPQWLLLATGMIIWWLAAYWMTGDKLWIVHDWPPDWQMDGRANGTGPVWWYLVLLPLIAGMPLLAPFLVGLWRLLKRREFVCGTSSFLTVFVLHSLMFWRGWFGSAGYARYFVCVSPVVALISLYGWNELVKLRARAFDLSKPSVAISVLMISTLTCFLYVDATLFARDAWAVETMHSWLRLNRSDFFEPGSGRITRLISSQAYPRILFDRDPWEKPSFTADRDYNIELLRQSPDGTLVLWDSETGPKWYWLRAEDFEAAGYHRLHSQDFRLGGYFMRLPWNRFGGRRNQSMHWFYKPSVVSHQPAAPDAD